MEPVPKVALLIETARGYGRDLLRGIVRYSRLHGPWSFYITPGDFHQAVPKMEQWGGTGIIARVETPKVADAILATGLPVVALDLSEQQLSPESPLSGLCEIVSDSHHAARMTAEHLLDRGFRHYAFVGVPGRIWSQRRRESFCDRLGEDGFEPHVYQSPKRKRDREWGREQTIMADWLRTLPKPIGLMACNDDRGREVLEACRAANMQVPEEIAVIGVDNDSLLCDLSDPPLSSVALNAERGGFEAAALLDRLMRGEIEDPRQIVVEPLHVVTRHSTDVIALDDREVAKALRLIRAGANRPIQVDDVVATVGLSRRTLEIRFQRALGRSIHAEIQRVRLERAKRLLLETELPIPKIAEVSGFATASYFAQAFRQEFDTTPARYRREHR
ncbi:MAG: substrate-binding domain-containing protein [Candidatus Nealsonbacteria bacterium]|nr:substrate-binding domain-containing protein [Candidatus Nealsonbacteria bacterium]